MAFKLAKEHLSLLVSLSMLLKLLFVGMIPADTFGGLVILASIHAKTIIDHTYPEQPDVYKKITEMEYSLLRLESIERELTALKIGASRR